MLPNLSHDGGCPALVQPRTTARATADWDEMINRDDAAGTSQ